MSETADNAIVEEIHAVASGDVVDSQQESVVPKSDENSETQTEPAQESQDESAKTNSEVSESATPKQSKDENAFFKSMRKRAEEEAEAKLKKQLDEFKAKLLPVLPDEYSDVDSFLKSLDEDSTQEEIDDAIDEAEETITEEEQVKHPTFTEKQIDAIVAKKLEAIPEFQELRKIQEQKKKDEEDRYIIDNFEEVKSKFTDIKSAEDVPTEVWGLWKLGSTGRSLLSCMKEHRYDTDMQKASQKGAAAVKGQMNSVSHTAQVTTTGTAPAALEEDIKIDPNTEAVLRKAGIPKDKWAMYYKKYHK